jgi:hypothetical protein
MIASWAEEGVCRTLESGREAIPVGNMRIPDRFKPGLLLLAKISTASYEEIVEAAKRAKSSFASNQELAVWISSEVPTMPVSDLGKIVDSLASLYRVRARSDMPISRLANDVREALRELLPEIGVEFESRLSALLLLPVFDVTAEKAKELQGRGERTLCDARILTDIRPVFEENIGSLPTAAIIVHTLQLGFHDSGLPTHREIYISLDSSDIKELKKVLERAEEKEKSLKLVLDAAKLRFINLD